ncbi:MAG: oligosaccharide flippase family protein, partial [Treponema sp.]|nr:oligosaccharide flippase family protein [Treponema sp.]
MASLKQKTFSGLIWASIGNVGHGLINLLVTFVLARILLPSDFGVLELVLVITSISTVLVDSGFSQAIIRDKEATDLDKNTVFLVNITIA